MLSKIEDYKNDLSHEHEENKLVFFFFLNFKKKNFFRLC